MALLLTTAFWVQLFEIFIEFSCTMSEISHPVALPPFDLAVTWLQ